MCTERCADNRLERCFVPIGLCSYSFYLLHFLLVSIIATQLRVLGLCQTQLGLIAATPIAIGIMTVISFAAYLTIEKASIATGRYLRRCFGGKIFPRKLWNL